MDFVTYKRITEKLVGIINVLMYAIHMVVNPLSLGGIRISHLEMSFTSRIFKNRTDLFSVDTKS